jgi:F420-dependent oxidoreductase-like protein
VGEVRLRIFVEPQQGATYAKLLSVAKVAEEEGFDAFFRSDHYLKMGEVDGLPGPTDVWTTLAGLARETNTIRLGSMMSSATFRLPGPLAIIVAEVDAMSGGRTELGIGAGWYEAEHSAYGIPFPPAAERFERLEEQLRIVLGLWGNPIGEAFSFDGRYYKVSDSPGLPKPVQVPRPPVIVGGVGKTRTPRLAALFADEFNVPFAPPEKAKQHFATVREACEQAGRDPATIRLSAAVTVCCGVDDVEIARRAAAIGTPVAQLRENSACGNPEELVERLAQWGDAGAGTLYLQIMDLDDLDHIRLIGSDVLRQVGQT